jgi:hypothetical protein
MKRAAILISLLASACFGQIDGGGTTGGDDDDMPPPPPPPTDVRIKVHDGQGPVSGIAVVFQDGSDAVISDAVTDAQGEAVAKLATGSVTVIRPADAMQPGSLASVYTYVAVKAGDTLDLVLPGIRTSNPQTINVTVPLTENNTPVQITTPCGSGAGTPPTVAVTLDGCGGETDFYVSEIGGDAAFLKRAQVSDPVDLSNEMYREALTSTYSVSNAPDTATVTVEKRLETDLFRPVFTTGPIAVAPDQPVDVTLPYLPTTEEQTYATVALTEVSQIVASRDPYGSGPAVIDLAAAMIIAPSQPKIAGDTVSWTEAGSGAPDLVLVSIQSATATRYVAAEHALSAVKVPHLPAAHDMYNLAATDTPSVALARVGGGYDGVRARVFAGPLAPMGGTATIAIAAGDRTTEPKQ